MLDLYVEPSWEKELKDEMGKGYYAAIGQFLKAEMVKGKIIYPKSTDIFNALLLCPFSQVKVVILGQDPYHNPLQAHGLCFSVADGIAPPPSLVNIFKEIKSDLGFEIPSTGNLNKWAQQGVLLLNASLTVEAHSPMSHSKIGWHIFTDAIIKKLSEQKENLVFLLWGKFAQSKAAMIDSDRHLILQAAHPSPLSAYNGFWGCKHFSKANDYLLSHHFSPIDWQLP
jgi:uracil-DNA glycosylase